MLGRCCSHQASSLQPKGEEKHLKQRFYDYRYKDLNQGDSDEDSFYDCINSHDWETAEFFDCSNSSDWQFDELGRQWQRVLKLYIDDGSGERVLDRSWRHVLTSTGRDESETSHLYKEAVAKVEKQARDVYIEEEISCSEDEFLQGMIKHGCFILQLALCSLGGPNPLCYPLDDPLFGKKRWNNKLIRFLVRWYTFSVGNQIPLVVLKVLMKQSFFQKVLELGKWKRPNDLARMALYDFLVEPMIDQKRRLHGLFHKRSRWHQEQPTTLHRALWLLLTGPGSSHGGDNHIDEDEDDHLYTTFPTIRSALELKEAGITFKSKEGMGTREIKFKKTMFGGFLYLPCIYMEPDTMKLFQKLIYEGEVKLDMNRREVSAYVSFMKELIRSPDDVKVLVTQGIIDTDPEYEQQLPAALSELRLLEVGNSHNLVTIRRQIRRYVKPSIRTKIVNLVFVGVFFTLVQTIFSVLGYIYPLGH